MYLRQVFFIVRRYAGHSKWQNIRHIKAEKDQQRSLMFKKLSRRIQIAIEENGNNCNPVSNVHLASAIEFAKSHHMPVTSIQNTIKSCERGKEGVQSFKFSVRGPKGSILLITGLTSSVRKTKHNMYIALKKIGGIITDQSLENHFDQKGIIVACPSQNIKNIGEMSVEHAIEAGAEEVSPADENNKFTFTCEASELFKVTSKLQELNYKVEETNISYIPKIKVNLNEDEMELMSNIIAKLEELPEVSEIHDNIA